MPHNGLRVVNVRFAAYCRWFAIIALKFAIIALKDNRRENRVVSDAAIKIDGLSPEERLDLLERLWDSLARTPADVPVTPEQRAELDRRLDDLDRDIQEGGELGVPWDEVLRQIRARS
jgi:putative addiction module component (TIGR02574 family)